MILYLAGLSQMTIVPRLGKSGLAAVRLLAIASCTLTLCLLVDLPTLNATPTLAKDGADDSGSHGSGDDHGGGNHDDKKLSGGEDLSHSSGSRSGSRCDDPSISLDLQYADGFREHVSDCVYVLTDQHGRVVVTRSATNRDMQRLQSVAP